MVDLTAYRARIGAFASRSIRMRSQCKQTRLDRKKRKSRRSCDLISVLFTIITLTTTVGVLATVLQGIVSDHQTLATTKTVQSLVTDAGTGSWAERFPIKDYLIGNHGAHMYNGNPPMQPKKRQRMALATNQKTLTQFAFGNTSKNSEPDPIPVQSDCVSTSSLPVLPQPRCAAPEPDTAEDDPVSCPSTPQKVVNLTSDSDSDQLDNSTPVKKPNAQTPKSTKKYKCKYNLKWFDSSPSLKTWCSRSTKGLSYAHCSVCDKDLNMSTGGLKDLLRHQESKIHSDNFDSWGTKPIDSHFTSSDASFDNLVTKAEVLWSNFVVEHQLSFRVCDHASKLFTAMFPDSKIAKNFRCGRTKARDIICNAVAPAMHDSVTNILQNNHFSLLTDDTTDSSTKQQCCILVRYFDESCGVVKGLFYKVLNLKSATSESIFNGITKVFRNENIPLNNILALGTDGANTMIGKVKGLYGRLKKVQTNIYSVWCICHRIHIVAKKSVSCMPKDIHELPVELFYWFKKSSKRCDAYEKMQNFCEVVNHRLLKPSDTRWLSMQQISDRLSEQWVSLQSFFNSLPTDYEIDSKGKKGKKVDKLTRDKILKIRAMLNSDVNRLCFLFMKDYLKKFTVFNCIFQTSKPMAYLIVTKLKTLIKEVLTCFVCSSVINEHKTDLRKIDIENGENLLELSDLWYGDSLIFDIFGQLTDNGKESDVQVFQEIVIKIYKASFRELVKMPFDDAVLVNLSALNPVWQGSIAVRSMFMSLVQLFPQVLTTDEKCKLDCELRLYDTFDMPQHISCISDVCTYWWKVGHLKDETGILIFGVLSKLVKALLVIPHGNAESEQIFSRLKLMKTKFKTSMRGQTLNAILTVNFNSNSDCYQYKPSEKVLKSASTSYSKKSVTLSEDEYSDFEEPAPVQKRARKPNKAYDDFVKD